VAGTECYDSAVLGSVADIVKATLVPGSTGFLVWGVLCGVALLHVRALERWARRWLVALSAAYILLSMPAVSFWLERGARPAYAPLDPAVDAHGATAVVVLGNGLVNYEDSGLAIESLTRRSAYNALECARLYRLLHPSLVIASGGLADPEVHRRSEAEAMRDALISLGVPREAIELESKSTNTADQARFVEPLLTGHRRFVLITTPIHMGRAMALFRSRGLDPVPAPSRIDYTGKLQQSALRFFPTSNALRASELAMYEYLGMAYAKSRGWLDAPHDAPQ
jgi:uncharacterized SAM-binding protein YcdF (DUF218 family)